MSTFPFDHYRCLGYEPRSGIIPRHFDVFKEVAAQLNYILVVRVTKTACAPWIEQNYPAKPPSIYKVKTSARTGKVTCSPDFPDYTLAEQIRHAHEAGYYVLEQPDKRGPLTARHPSLGTLRWPYAADSAEMNEVGQVIDPKSGLALTGDYDLMGVIDATATGRALTLIHDADAPEEMKTPEGLLYERTNPLAQRARRILNGRLGSRPRIMHGPHDLKFDVDRNNKDGCIAFYPDQQVYFFPKVDDLKDFYDRGLHRRKMLPLLASEQPPA